VIAWNPSTAAAHPRWVFEDLTDVHAARHAQRVEQDVDRRSVLHERHVLVRHDAGDDALVAVTTGHLVTDRQRTLGRDVDLDHLEHARRQLVAALHVLHAADFFLLDRFDARPEPAVRVDGLLLRFLRALDPIGRERLDLFEYDLGVLRLGNLLARVRVDDLLTRDLVDLVDHLLEDLDGAKVHVLLVPVDFLLQLLLLVVGHVHATAETAACR
jgi:hypothetical protein